MTVPSGPGTGSIPTQKEPRREVVTSAEAMMFCTDGSMNALSSSALPQFTWRSPIQLRRIPPAGPAGRAQ